MESELQSELINIENTPRPPEIGYYNKNMDSVTNDTNPYSVNYNTLYNNVTTSCSGVNSSSDGIFKSTDPKIKNNYASLLPNNIANIDIPYYLGKQGVLPAALENEVGPKVKNQIEYLVCQLINARNRFYDTSKISHSFTSSTLQSIFSKASPSIKSLLALVFIITMYFLVSGFISSFDVAANVMNILQKDSDYSISYWGGIFFGLLISLIALATTYSLKVKENLENIQKEEITNDPYGNKVMLNETSVNIDYLTLILYIMLIYAFIAVLFTIKRSSFNNITYSILIVSVYIVLTFLLYILYAYIPFFNTAEKGKLLNTTNKELRLFIEPPPAPNEATEDTSDIITNQNNNDSLRIVFLVTVIIAYIITILYFLFKSTNSFIKGLFGSFTVLILPMLWVLNFIIGIQFFYIYPIVLLLLRFFRYIIMFILYISTKNKPINLFSDDLIKQLQDFKNYTPSWGLLGIDELKLVLNIFGYENIFSDTVISNNNNGSNISDNKYIVSSFLGFLIEKNTNGIFISMLICGLTFFISIIILYGIVKIQKDN